MARQRKSHSEATKAKIRASNLRTWSSPTLRRKQAQRALSRPPFTPEHCRKLSEAAKRRKDNAGIRALVAYWQEPVNCARRSNEVTRRFADPNEREAARARANTQWSDPFMHDKASAAAKRRLERLAKKSDLHLSLPKGD